MSLGVAIQSVIYYVVACSACHKYAYRRRRKREAQQAKADNNAIETEEPGLYRHPSPFSTNIYWREELALGPGPPARRAGKKDDKSVSQRQLLTAGVDSSMGSSAGGLSQDDPLDIELAHHQLDGEGWNRRRYQREDEALWGHYQEGTSGRPSTTRSDPRDNNMGSSVGDVGLGKPVQENYYYARNPPVNELHPPVVSTPPANRSETRWMLQPPPSARFMNGKERAVAVNGRDRSDSGDGKLRKSEGDGDHNGLGRRLVDNQMEEKARKSAHSGTVPIPIARSTSSRRRSKARASSASPSGGDAQPHDRSRDFLDPNPNFFATISRDSSQRRRLRQSRQSVASSEDSLDDDYPRENMRLSKRLLSTRKEIGPALRKSVSLQPTPSPGTNRSDGRLKGGSLPLGDLMPSFNNQTSRTRPNSTGEAMSVARDGIGQKDDAVPVTSFRKEGRSSKPISITKSTRVALGARGSTISL